MKSTYRVLAFLIAAAVVLQAMWIVLGNFIMIHDVEEEGLVVDKNYEANFAQVMHGNFGMMVIPLLAILLLIISFFAKVPGGVKWALIVFGLVALQITLAFVSFGVPAVGALHALNAFALMGCAAMAGRRVVTLPPATTTTPDQTPTPGATV